MISTHNFHWCTLPSDWSTHPSSVLWLADDCLHCVPISWCSPHAWVGYWVITELMLLCQWPGLMTLDDDITLSLTQWSSVTWILEQTGGHQPNMNNETWDCWDTDRGRFKVTTRIYLILWLHYIMSRVSSLNTTVAIRATSITVLLLFKDQLWK